MRNWSRDLPGYRCPWADDLADAERVAVTLGIGLEVWDCEEEYQRTVVDYLVDAYARGLTPNPDVMCNQTVKFGTFADRAFSRGADLIATGHYARVRRGQHDRLHPATARRGRAQGPDLLPLARGRGGLVAHALPCGRRARQGRGAPHVRREGPGRGVKPDSDGICFVGPVGIRTFLLDTLERRAGDIVEWETGRVLGHHDGAFLFTVGAAEGPRPGRRPCSLCGLDGHREERGLRDRRPCVPGPVVYAAQPLRRALDCRRGTRRRRLPGEDETHGELRPARVEVLDGGRARVSFPEPVRTVAPGQSAVVYGGLVCLGGGNRGTKPGGL